MADLGSKVDALLAECREKEAQLQEYRNKLKEVSKLQASLTEFATAKRKQLAALKKQAGAAAKAADTAAGAADADAKLMDVECSLEPMSVIGPSTGSLFVRLFLGRVNVRVSHEDDRKQLVDEYNKFKDRTNLLFLLWPIVGLLAGQYYPSLVSLVYTLTHVWLLYYYVSLSLRQNILRVNGSSIRPWWIYHHYMSAMMSVALLMWGDDILRRNYMPQFCGYCIYQGIVQILQATYQRRRLYTRRSLGKAGSMDVSQTETLVEVPTELYALLVFVFVLQVWQIFNGVALGMEIYNMLDAAHPIVGIAHYWQAAFIAAVFPVLGCINMWQTFAVVRAKHSRASKSARHLQTIKNQ